MSRASDTIERSGDNPSVAGTARVPEPHGNACRDYRDRRVPG